MSDAARHLLAEALEIDAGAMADNVAMENFEPWTSVAHLRLILALEEKLGAELAPDDALAIQSLADVARLLERGRST
ncbi:MAG: acyl carrier protein [Rhodospirillales bacterium]